MMQRFSKFLMIFLVKILNITSISFKSKVFENQNKIFPPGMLKLY